MEHKKHIKFIPIKDVLEKVSFSRSTLQRFEQEGNFPKKVRLGRNRIAYVEHEVDEWIQQKIESRGSEPSFG